VARLNDVNAFGYNSAGSERIWMKFGELRVHVYCLELSLTFLGAIHAEAAAAAQASFVFIVLWPVTHAHGE